MMIKNMSSRATLVISIILTTTVAAIAGNTIYVDDDEPANFTTINAAVSRFGRTHDPST